ncbi:acyltransferase [Burkholderiaceae bacterium DAT-1]|nr:acyltransferase [Burkholderiaceae bacterium DAT-1]
MLGFLPPAIRLAISAVLLTLNVVICSVLIVGLGLFKLVLPVKPVRQVLDRILNTIAEQWIVNNGFWMALAGKIDWQVEGLDGLQYKGWYLVESNHQSWVDIIVLQKVLNRRIPFLKFFLKRELIYIPFIGLGWWALDFPFMKRRDANWLMKHPEKRGEDLETARKACEKFSLVPTSVMNFLEGTRFTPAKHAKQKSAYQYLLKPKAGGIAAAMNAMGSRFNALVDVTIYYPDGIPTFYDLLAGRIKRVVVNIKQHHIPAHLCTGDYLGDSAFRKQMQEWLHELWLEKDAVLIELRRKYGQPD